MAIVKKRKKWQVRLRDRRGKWYPAKSFDRKIDAQKYERSLLADKDKGVSAPLTLVKRLILSDYFIVWFSECRSTVSEGWKQTNQQVFRDHIKPFLGELKLMEVKRRDIELLMTKLKRSGLGPQSRTHVYNLLHKMFDDAIEHFEYLSFSPITKRLKPQIPKKERNFLTNDDAWILLNYCKGHWLGPAVWLAGLAALRPCEVQALVWENVDLVNQRILIGASYNRKEKRIQQHPKQVDWGKAPVPACLRDYLVELKAKSKGGVFVVESARGGMLSYHSFQKGIRRLCQQAGVKEITPHELRHTATELYYTAGASTEDLRRLLNHASSKTTETYIHRTDRRLGTIADQIGCTEPALKLVK